MEAQTPDLEALIAQFEAETLEEIEAKVKKIEVIESAEITSIDEDLRPFVFNKKQLVPATARPVMITKPTVPVQEEKGLSQTPETSHPPSQKIKTETTTPDYAEKPSIKAVEKPVNRKAPAEVSSSTPELKGTMTPAANQSKKIPPTKVEKAPESIQSQQPISDEPLNLKIKSGDEAEKEYKKRQEKLQDIIGTDKGGTI